METLFFRKCKDLILSSIIIKGVQTDGSAFALKITCCSQHVMMGFIPSWLKYVWTYTHIHTQIWDYKFHLWVALLLISEISVMCACCIQIWCFVKALAFTICDFTHTHTHMERETEISTSATSSFINRKETRRIRGENFTGGS